MTGSEALFYTGIAVGVFYLFYLRMSAVTWEERERLELTREDLHLGHLMQLIQAPDVRQLVEDPDGRDSLFRRFSAFLLDDVRVLGRRYRLGLAGVCWMLLFYFGYAVVKLRSRMGWGKEDLLFLVALELNLFRSIRRT